MRPNIQTSMRINQDAPSPAAPGPAFLPDPVGIGLRGPHYRDILETRPPIGWLEVHPENYFGGGLHRHYLMQIREHYPLSFHAVGLSLGSAHGINPEHVRRIKELADIFAPFQISDHASWSASGNAHLNDLLPLPYTRESVAVLCRNINFVQDMLQQKILVENPSTYLNFAGNEMQEFEMMNELAKRTGCGILLDLNNIYVQAHNHGFDAFAYVAGIDVAPVGEFHLAGHSERPLAAGSLLIDTHNRPVKGDVWDLYAAAVQRFGAVPSLIEWDADLPPLSILLREADKARDIMQQRKVIPHAAE